MYTKGDVVGKCIKSNDAEVHSSYNTIVRDGAFARLGYPIPHYSHQK